MPKFTCGIQYRPCCWPWHEHNYWLICIYICNIDAPLIFSVVKARFYPSVTMKTVLFWITKIIHNKIRNVH